MAHGAAYSVLNTQYWAIGSAHHSPLTTHPSPLTTHHSPLTKKMAYTATGRNRTHLPFDGTRSGRTSGGSRIFLVLTHTSPSQGSQAMAMVCPQCNGSFEQRWHCPSCGVRLLYQTRQTRTGGGSPGETDPWQQTPWGRILIGLLLAQGIYYSLRHLFTAGLLVSG